MKKTKEGVVYPVHIPVCTCHITLDEENQIKLTPRYGKIMKEKGAEKKIKVFIASEPSYDTRTLSGPMARLLFNYKRLNELSTCYVSHCCLPLNPYDLLILSLHCPSDRRGEKGGQACSLFRRHDSNRKFPLSGRQCPEPEL